MRPVPGTQQLQVRFQLRAKAAGAGGYTALSVPGLDVWRTSPAGLGRHPGDVWTVAQPVAHLQRGVSYRFRVRFRWLGAGTTVLRRAHRLSRPCLTKAARYA